MASFTAVNQRLMSAIYASPIDYTVASDCTIPLERFTGVQGGVRDMSDNEPQSAGNSGVRQAAQNDVLHHHLQAVHATTRGPRVPPRPRLLLHQHLIQGRPPQAHRRTVHQPQHEGRLQGLLW